jgi:hypothetical protein
MNSLIAPLPVELPPSDVALTIRRLSRMMGTTPQTRCHSVARLVALGGLTTAALAALMSMRQNETWYRRPRIALALGALIGSLASYMLTTEAWRSGTSLRGGHC